MMTKNELDLKLLLDAAGALSQLSREYIIPSSQLFDAHLVISKKITQLHHVVMREKTK